MYLRIAGVRPGKVINVVLTNGQSVPVSDEETSGSRLRSSANGRLERLTS